MQHEAREASASVKSIFFNSRPVKGRLLLLGRRTTVFVFIRAAVACVLRRDPKPALPLSP